jgi:hypothetical protein
VRFRRPHIHLYRQVRFTGIWSYEECRCEKRRIVQRGSGGHQPRCESWIETGEFWSSPPPGSLTRPSDAGRSARPPAELTVNRIRRDAGLAPFPGRESIPIPPRRDTVPVELAPMQLDMDAEQYEKVNAAVELAYGIGLSELLYGS